MADDVVGMDLDPAHHQQHPQHIKIEKDNNVDMGADDLDGMDSPNRVL
jgi:hypothetical protein